MQPAVRDWDGSQPRVLSGDRLACVRTSNGVLRLARDLLDGAVMMRGLRTLFVACVATTAACTGAPGMPSQRSQPSSPPANVDFDSITVPPPSCNNGWLISLVSHQGSDPQWAVAPDGTMHIMYIGYGEGQTALRHVAEAEPARADTVSTMGLGSLAIAPDGTANAFLAARSGMTEEPDAVGIVHVAHAHDGWHLDPAPVSSDGGPINASAIDSDGHAHLAYGDQSLFYANNVSGEWVKTSIGPQTFVSVFALYIDARKHVHIWFSGIEPGDTTRSNHWASNYSGSWRVVTMPDSDVAPAIDRDGVPHLITVDSSGLNHVWRDGDRWRTEPLPALGKASVFDLRVDDNGKLHVLIETAASSIIYADNVAGSWTLDPVITSDTLGMVPDARLGLDAKGQPHIAFKGPVSGASFGFAKHCP
jgi:hypothetical protein